METEIGTSFPGEMFRASMLADVQEQLGNILLMCSGLDPLFFSLISAEASLPNTALWIVREF